jgi:hypothetical protein
MSQPEDTLAQAQRLFRESQKKCGKTYKGNVFNTALQQDWQALSDKAKDEFVRLATVAQSKQKTLLSFFDSPQVGRSDACASMEPHHGSSSWSQETQPASAEDLAATSAWITSPGTKDAMSAMVSSHGLPLAATSFFVEEAGGASDAARTSAGATTISIMNGLSAGHEIGDIHQSPGDVAGSRVLARMDSLDYALDNWQQQLGPTDQDSVESPTQGNQFGISPIRRSSVTPSASTCPPFKAAPPLPPMSQPPPPDLECPRAPTQAPTLTTVEQAAQMLTAAGWLVVPPWQLCAPPSLSAPLHTDFQVASLDNGNFASDTTLARDQATLHTDHQVASLDNGTVASGTTLARDRDTEPTLGWQRSGPVDGSRWMAAQDRANARDRWMAALAERVGTRAGAGAGMHIRREVMPLRSGAKATVIDILKWCTSLPSGNPLIVLPPGQELSPHMRHPQIVEIAHGFQVRTACNQAVVKIFPSSGTVSIGGASPSVAVPFVSEWTTEATSAPKKRRRN